jgi:hypothetical protein
MALLLPDTEMRLKLLASMMGEKLKTTYTGGSNASSRVGATGETFGSTQAYDGGTALSFSSSLSTTETRYAGIDASITSAT